MRTSVVSLLLITLLASLAQALAQTNPFESEIRAFEAEDARSWPEPNSLVFIGSSTIKGWSNLEEAFPEFNVLNRGFGGSQTSDALFFVDRIATPYRPPLVVFYEGDNDLASGKSVETVFRDTTNFFARVQSKSPNTHILYVSVKPSPSRASLLPQVRDLNDRVREFTEQSATLHFADTFTPMMDASGQPRPELFQSDNLHMNQQGYALWTEILGPILDDFAANYPISIAKVERGSLLIDFGGPESLSGATTGGSVAWNNVTTAVAASNTGEIPRLTSARGVSSSVGLQMVSRFNGANENGTPNSSLFPATATRDSVFGNTETFSGLANVTPIFRLTGLAPESRYKLTFYASRMGVSDNRQTRYVVAGAGTNSVDLNAANNIDTVAVADAVQPAADGSIQIDLTPGPANNNANHFTYLGVLRVESVQPAGELFLLDFGGAGLTTSTQGGPMEALWNDLPLGIGSVENGVAANLVGANGAPSGIDLRIIDPFNGANANGATESGIFPASATQDSLFGNTELFGGKENVFPRFALENLQTNALYMARFYASRTGVADNRETIYTVAGASTNQAALDASGNTNNVALLPDLSPAPNGQLLVSLAPGPNNNSANHFTYLGALELSWRIGGNAPLFRLSVVRAEPGSLTLRASGVPGMIYTLQQTTDFITWIEVATLPLTNNIGEIEVIAPQAKAFYRLLQ